MYLIVFLNILLHGSYAGSRMLVALFALELGASPLMIGVMVGLYSVPTFLLGLFAGRMCDRQGARRPLLLGAACLAAGLVLPYFWQQLAGLLVSSLVAGTAFVFYNAAAQYFTGAYGLREQRAANFSTLALGYSVSSLIGPLTAGYAIDYLGHAQAYLCIAAMALVPVMVLLFCRVLGDKVSPERSEGRKSALDLLRNPELRRVLVLSAMVVTGWDLYMFYLPIYAHSIGLAASSIGTIMGVFAAATFAIRFGTPHLVRMFTARRVLSVAMWFGACMFVAFPFIKSGWLLAAASFAIGLALGCGQPLSLLLAYNRSPAGRAGEVTGIRLMLNHATHASVPILAGALGGVFGMVPVFHAIAAVLGYCGHLSTKIVRSTDGGKAS
jgi:predicted MFS family arabinose efflux permease